MTKKEMLEVSRKMLYVYSGILYHNQKFGEGNRQDFSYVRKRNVPIWR